MGFAEVLDVVKYFIPLISGVVIWFVSRKNRSQLSRLSLLEKSKSLICGNKYEYLEAKISREVLAYEIKIRNDEYFDFGVFLIKNKILTGIQYQTLKNYLTARHGKVKFKVSHAYMVDFIVSKVMAIFFSVIMFLYIFISIIALNSLIVAGPDRDIYGILIDSIKFCLLFLSSVFLFFITCRFFNMNPRLKYVIFMNVQLKKLEIPPELIASLNVIVNRKRLTKSKALRIIRSVILPLHRH